MSDKNSFNLLIVDDFKDILELLVLVLSENVEYAKISTARDGEEAIALCQKEKFDLIITDFKMPNLNGYDFAKSLRSDKKRLSSHSPIIFISGHMLELNENDNLGDNTSYISKPLDIDLLIKEVCRYLNISCPKIS